MADYFELDFLNVASKKSGDAIPIRYEANGNTLIHVVDGGFQDTGASVVAHINKYYGNPRFIDHVVATHPDGDHAGGLRSVLEDFDVGTLWMLRPWDYADEIIDRFTRFTSVENLKKRLKELYPNLVALEEIAKRRGIPIGEPFQGTDIGAFHVLAPTKARYLDMVVQSEKTPESLEEQRAMATAPRGLLAIAQKVVNFVRAAWGEEVFSSEETSAENEMSVVQYAYLAEKRILLTADAGRAGLTEATDYLEAAGITLPGIDKFQVPHHGSRRNVSTEVLDRLLGPCLSGPAEHGSFTAAISSAKEDEDHPKRAVVRACIHRGGRVFTTEGSHLQVHQNAPDRGWTTAKPMDYPDDQEE